MRLYKAAAAISCGSLIKTSCRSAFGRDGRYNYDPSRMEALLLSVPPENAAHARLAAHQISILNSDPPGMLRAVRFPAILDGGLWQVKAYTVPGSFDYNRSIFRTIPDCETMSHTAVLVRLSCL